MKNKKTEANISMVVSKTFSGLNMNALKYLLPLWMSPLTGASFRCMFTAVAFWEIGWITRRYRYLWVYVSLFSGAEQDNAGLEFYFHELATDLGIFDYGILL